MDLLLVLTVVAGSLIIYHHAVYPFLLKWLAVTMGDQPKVVAPMPMKGTSELPFITIVIPCFNEEAVIAEKLHNMSFLDYPLDRFRVLVVNDGSSDKTVSVFNRVKNEIALKKIDLQLIDFKSNRGKVAVLNDVLSEIDHGIVLLTDTSALVSIDALRIVAGHMEETSVGVVAGTYRLLNPGSEGEESYWRYQTQIKEMESRLGSSIGVHGALYAFRAELFEPLPRDTINDDFMLPMTIVSQGYRCIYDANIIAVELEESNQQMDMQRRKRISAGNTQQALRLVSLLHPRNGGVAFNFLSGKFLRVLMPFLLFFFFVASLVLAQDYGVFWMAALAQVSGYCLVLVRHLFPNRSWPKVVNLAHYLVSGHFANGLGALHYLADRESYTAWQPAQPSESIKGYVPRLTLVGKRLFDIFVALVGIILTLPLWPLIVIAIKLESPGPAFFQQLRIGRCLPDRTELFKMIKFRTMGVNAESKSGAVWAANNDPRITKVGKFLRKTRLDELPQLINVLRGEMSIVGPRPERPGISKKLDLAIPFYVERTFFVMPGITGLAQVNQGYDTCIDDVKNKLLYDHAYALSLTKAKSWLMMDLTVMFKTVWVMVAGRGQ